MINIKELKNPGFTEKMRVLEFYNSGFPMSEWGMKKLDNCICFVLETDDMVRGLVIGKRSKNEKSLVLLSALLIGEELRGNGYAKVLVKKFVEKAFDDNAVIEVGLHFRDSNNLRNFYEKLGFGQHVIDGTYKNGEAKHYMQIIKDDIMR